MTRLNALTEAREQFTRRYLIRTLEKHEWNVTRAASEVGIERSYLYELMRKYEIKRP